MSGGNPLNTPPVSPPTVDGPNLDADYTRASWDEVAALQRHLNQQYGAQLMVDGDFGPNTKAALQDVKRNMAAVETAKRRLVTSPRPSTGTSPAAVPPAPQDMSTPEAWQGRRFSQFLGQMDPSSKLETRIGIEAKVVDPTAPGGYLKVQGNGRLKIKKDRKGGFHLRLGLDGLGAKGREQKVGVRHKVSGEVGGVVGFAHEFYVPPGPRAVEEAANLAEVLKNPKNMVVRSLGAVVDRSGPGALINTLDPDSPAGSVGHRFAQQLPFMGLSRIDAQRVARYFTGETVTMALHSRVAWETALDETAAQDDLVKKIFARTPGLQGQLRRMAKDLAMKNFVNARLDGVPYLEVTKTFDNRVAGSVRGLEAVIGIQVKATNKGGQGANGVGPVKQVKIPTIQSLGGFDVHATVRWHGHESSHKDRLDPDEIVLSASVQHPRRFDLEGAILGPVDTVHRQYQRTISSRNSSGNLGEEFAAWVAGRDSIGGDGLRIAHQRRTVNLERRGVATQPELKFGFGSVSAIVKHELQEVVGVPQTTEHVEEHD